ncbi:hypothetical protein EG329_001367 [Mollisiaceae sp. DMI_Dod_QoI]|nr:hypothetical protein EG329_001367 [Helotiales sp. DMI_Dod_QoI]
MCATAEGDSYEKSIYGGTKRSTKNLLSFVMSVSAHSLAMTFSVAMSPVTRLQQARLLAGGKRVMRVERARQNAMVAEEPGARYCDDGSTIPDTQASSENIIERPKETESIAESPKETSTNRPSDSARPFERTGNEVPATKAPEDGETSIGTIGASFLLKSIQKSTNLFKKPLGEPPVDAEPWCTASFDTYWEQVHDHWPLLHQPTLSLESDPLAVTASVVIIGCWFKGPGNASDLIVNTHERLVDKFLEELCRPGAGLDEDRPWRIEVYQAVLLNIIFAFYSGKKQLIARAGVLFSLLIVTLRHMGMFSSDRAEYQERTHFPATFLPFVLSNRERRVRLVFFMLKIDAYLFLVNGQPPHLQPEELDVSLLSTFALWNAHPLDEFYKRLPQEPLGRPDKRLSHLVRGPDLLATSELLIEDVQIGFCSMASALWRFTLTRRSSEATGTESKALLAQQLDNWGYQLDRISALCKAQEARTSSVELPLRAYFGLETEICPPILTRVRWLIHETRMLQNAMSLYSYADMHALGRFVRRQTDTNTDLPISHANGEQDAGILQWARSLDSRKAVLISLTVLKAGERLKAQNDRRSRPVAPLVNAALENSAVVLWAWAAAAATEGSCSCPDMSNRTTDDTNTSGGSEWTLNWHGLVGDAPPLCACMAEEWIKRFAAVRSS